MPVGMVAILLRCRFIQTNIVISIHLRYVCLARIVLVCQGMTVKCYRRQGILLYRIMLCIHDSEGRSLGDIVPLYRTVR